jgi:hypothetical protein
MSPSTIVVVVLILSLLTFDQVKAQTQSPVPSLSLLCIPPDGGNASSVIGQTSFSTNIQGSGLNQVNNPTSVIVDENNAMVYVADTGNNRILRYSSTNAMMTNPFADLILFGNGSIQCNPSALYSPRQLDYLGTDIYVVDSSHNRVLKISGAPTANTTIASASTIFGQPSGSICNNVGSLSDFSYPQGLAITNNGTMYVSDSFNCLVKRFDNANNASNYPAPTSLLGTYSPICNQLQPNQNIFSANLGFLSLDKSLGHLFLADSGNARVLLFYQAHLLANESGADMIFGQPDFSTKTGGCAINQLSLPVGVHYDSNSDVLIVSDTTDDRVVFFANAVATPCCPQPLIAAVLGQNNTFTCVNSSVATQNQFINPNGVFYSSAFPGVFLLVADLINNRVLRMQCSNSTFSSSESFSQTLGTSLNASVSLAASTVPASTVPASGAGNASSVAGASSSGGGASPSGVAVASSSSSGVAVASSSGPAAAASSGVAVASSSGAAPVSSGVSNPPSSLSNSSGVFPSSTGPAPTGSVPPPTPSGAAPSGSGSTSASQSNTPSETNPQNTATATPILPPPVPSSGVSIAPAVCGNGVIEKGEQCDSGNTVPRTKCCTSICTNLPAGAVCGKATSKCTRRPKCRKSLSSRQLTCTPGVAKPVGTRCGKGGIFSRKTCKADGSCSQ